MSYTALYRKWRPDNFEDVKGQDHIVTTLKNQVIADRVGHAYLFCGTRGTGKTTIAKILAKAVNCDAVKDGSPCGECESCRAIAAGTSMNVIEIDAASNNGVDNIREIRDEVRYSPAEGRYKVYIIDEVHMLSTGAFNALLKTLEEPPSYVIFILATTEAHKIPVTILSRCQRYDFKRIDVETISARLKELMDAEGVSADEKAVRYIAKVADGGMRDALSLLDQCISFYYGQSLSYDKVLEVLGAVDTELFSELLRMIMADDIVNAMKLIEDVVVKGRDLYQFTVDLTWYLRNLLLVRSSDEDIEDIIDVSSENLKRLKEEASVIKTESLMRYIRIFSALSNDIRYASQKRVLLEMAVIKLCRPSMEKDNESVLERIRLLEEKAEKGAFNAMQPAGDKEQDKEDRYIKPEEEPKLPPALSEDVKKAASMWKLILKAVEEEKHGMIARNLATANVSAVEDNKLLIVTKSDMAASALRLGDNEEQLSRIIDEKVGKHVDIEITHMEEGKRFSDYYVDLSKINAEIEVED